MYSKSCAFLAEKVAPGPQGAVGTVRLPRHADRPAMEDQPVAEVVGFLRRQDCPELLLHLARGTGLHGLTGIPPVRGKLIRPLLTTSRAVIEDYLRRYRIPHVEDSTNRDDAYSRNKVRHQVLPVLKEINPGIIYGACSGFGHRRDHRLFAGGRRLSPGHCRSRGPMCRPPGR